MLSWTRSGSYLPTPIPIYICLRLSPYDTEEIEARTDLGSATRSLCYVRYRPRVCYAQSGTDVWCTALSWPTCGSQALRTRAGRPSISSHESPDNGGAGSINGGTRPRNGGGGSENGRSRVAGHAIRADSVRVRMAAAHPKWRRRLCTGQRSIRKWERRPPALPVKSDFHGGSARGRTFRVWGPGTESRDSHRVT
eukprot:2568616-Rhodomonas_salina.1